MHAGLECGIIQESYPDMDMISIGPTCSIRILLTSVSICLLPVRGTLLLRRHENLIRIYSEELSKGLSYRLQPLLDMAPSYFL